MKVLGLLKEIYRRDKVLALTGWFHLLLLVLILCIAPFDSRTVMGINAWIKPLKFTISIVIYLWTMAWFLDYLTGPRWLVRLISWGISTAMLVEICCIVLQAARATTLHYNVSTSFDGIVFTTMGIMIIFNTLFILLALILFLTKNRLLPPAYLWGIRLGLLILLLGSIEGMVMITRAGHTVGLADGGPGMPLLNWSTRGGDLRIAHMLGLHALQILPLAGYLITKWKAGLPARRQLAYLATFTMLYLAVAALLFWQAMSGRPLIALGAIHFNLFLSSLIPPPSSLR
jgi:hypothetical protein